MIELPNDITTRIEGFLASGYASSEEVLREALMALESRDADLAAIREGLEDEIAGRIRPASEAIADLRSKHGLSPQ